MKTSKLQKSTTSNTLICVLFRNPEVNTIRNISKNLEVCVSGRRS